MPAKCLTPKPQSVIVITPSNTKPGVPATGQHVSGFLNLFLCGHHYAYMCVCVCVCVFVCVCVCVCVFPRPKAINT